MSESKRGDEKVATDRYILVINVAWTARDEQLKETLKRKECLDWTIECAWDSDDSTVIGLMSKQSYQSRSAVAGPLESVVRSIQTDVHGKAKVSMLSCHQIIAVEQTIKME